MYKRQDKTSGQKRSKLKVVLDNVQFLSTRGSASGAGGGQPAGAGDEADPAASDRPAPRAGGRPEAPGGPPKGDEDVPF